MSTIAGSESANSQFGAKKYNNQGWDGDDYDFDDGYDCGRAYGYWQDGIWYPPGRIAPPKEITFTAEELKALKKRFSNEGTIAASISTKSEKTDEFFNYVDYLDQEFKKLQKTYEDASSELIRARNFATYFIGVNKKQYYACEYSTYENGHSVYIAKHVPLRVGDLISGMNRTTQAEFNFVGGAVVCGGLKGESFLIYPHGIVCQKDGIYDIEIILEFGKDVVRFKPTAGNVSAYEKAKTAYTEASGLLLKFMQKTTTLRNKIANIIDRGAKVDPENLSGTLKRWQLLDRIVEYEIYEPYEKKVRRYGTSY